MLSIIKFHGFDDALDKVRQIFETGGKGHSCGIYSFDDDHIHRLALMAPVSRMMVRQVQSRSNAGTFTNGMPMTSSMGCGVWGGNITNENISLKHYMNVTWVSRPIPEDKPSEEGAVRRVLQQRRSLSELDVEDRHETSPAKSPSSASRRRPRRASRRTCSPSISSASASR